MTWQGFRLTYELHSPLHIGYHTIGNVQRTRDYIPARNLWGAVTERLTRGGFSAEDAPAGDYQEIGAWVKQHCAFSYFFVCEGEALLNPQYKDGVLHYGPDLSQAAFERRYLDAHVTTALDATTTSAEDGSLHEVEFIAPHRLDDASNGERTRLRGWVFLDETAQARQSEIQAAVEELHIGGERRYGFGHIHLTSDWEKHTLPEGFISNHARPCIEVAQSGDLLAHTLANGVEACGQIEPVVGRKTLTSGKFGHKLTQGQLCWSPGAKLLNGRVFKITQQGLWQCS